MFVLIDLTYTANGVTPERAPYTVESNPSELEIVTVPGTPTAGATATTAVILAYSPAFALFRKPPTTKSLAVNTPVCVTTISPSVTTTVAGAAPNVAGFAVTNDS